MPPTPPSFLPYGRQTIDDEDIAAVVSVLRSDFLTQGPAVAALETALAAATGAAEAVACANGTAALHLAALALDLGPGDAVVVPSVTFLATANAARFVGAEVVFADVNAQTGLMEPVHLQDAIERAVRAGLRPRAVFPVHFAGQTVDMAGIAGIAAEYGLSVVEDACHALGTRTEGSGGWSPVGSCGQSRMACFSFHPVKTIAAGEGGAVTTNDPDLAARLRQLRNHGMERDPARFTLPDQALAGDGTPNPWYYEMDRVGFNYRLTDLQSALALTQLAKLGAFVERRRHLMALYDDALGRLAPVARPLGRVPGCQPGWHLCVALIDFAGIGRDRATVMTALRAQGIGTQVHYLPVHRQPYYSGRYGKLDLPGADAYYGRALSLPLFPAMADEDVGRVADALAGALAGALCG